MTPGEDEPADVAPSPQEKAQPESPAETPGFGVQPMWADDSRNYRPGPLPVGHDGLVGQVEERVLGTARGFDRLQSRILPIAFGYAVMKKYFDDEGSRLAALMAYYTFVSLFPLAVLGVAVLNLLFARDPQTLERLIAEIIPPAYQQQILDGYATLPGQGGALVVGLVGLLIAGTAGAFSLYAALNQVYAVPYRYRYGFGPRYLRVVAVVALLGVSVGLVGIAAAVVGLVVDLAAVERGAVFLVTATMFTLALYGSAKLLLRRPVTVRELLPGAALAGIIVAGVLGLGSFLVGQFIANSTPIYGAFASVVGIISVLLLATNGLVIAFEISVVSAWQLWPRGLDINLLYPADERALAILTLMDERMPSQRNDVRFDAAGHFDPRRTPFDTLNHRQPGIPRTPFDELG